MNRAIVNQIASFDLQSAVMPAPDNTPGPQAKILVIALRCRRVIKVARQTDRESCAVKISRRCACV
jgi:hypothetical protein